MGKTSVLCLIIFCLECFSLAQYQPSFNYESDNIITMVSSRVEKLLKNDELECLPRLLCEYTSGGNPGQGRALNIDLQSLFRLLDYMGIDQSNVSPVMEFAKAAALGFSRKGDSYECYRSYPRCPRDQTRLLYYLNNHRGGFFRGFGGYYHRGNDDADRKLQEEQAESRIVNNQALVEIQGYGSTSHDLSFPSSFPETSQFIFTNNHRNPKLLDFVKGTDRLPNRLSFPSTLGSEGSLTFPNRINNVAQSNFFPRL